MVSGYPDIRSVIDLGTNTVLMVTGAHREDGSLQILDDAHAIARMGRGVDANRRILPETVDRVCAFLRSYRDRARSLGADRVLAFGTSALRDAANREEFIAHVQRTVGIPLRVVSGSEEAGLTFTGAGFGLELPPRYGVIDIGGGSTELALGTAGRIEQSQSVDVGAVRITERCFPGLPPDSGQREAATDAVQSALDRLFPFPADVPLVGVAGTVTTLAAMDRGTARFDAESLNGHFLTADRVDQLAEYLLSLPYPRLRSIPQVDAQRADIISAGSLILSLALRQWKCPGLTVSTRGIRYGLLLREFAG